MSCFGGLSPVLRNIGQVLRLHCGSIVCAPGVSGQDVVDQLPLAGNVGVQDTSVDPSLAPLKGGLLLFGLFSCSTVCLHCSSVANPRCSCWKQVCFGANALLACMLCPPMPCLVLPSPCLVLPCPALPCPALPCPALPCLKVPLPHLARPSPCLVLPCPAALYCPALPCLALPSSAFASCSSALPCLCLCTCEAPSSFTQTDSLSMFEVLQAVKAMVVRVVSPSSTQFPRYKLKNKAPSL